MTHQSQQVLDAALALPEADRAEIAGSLISSLEVDADVDADAAWAAEIERRLASIDQDNVQLLPWDVLMGELRSRRHG